ncbi:hypothetical protein BKA70DRAFT_1078178, partial [Coprinopsis sp. MPI-PUGE-AT-0042]
DAWHYTGHRSTDALRLNSGPVDVSQPDLIVSTEDHNGTARLSRAFNAETAEQLNTWITCYEA